MTFRIVITGGAGFVGSNLSVLFKAARENTTVVAFDNLKRRGSELALERLQKGGVEFVHGDVRSSDDLCALGAFDLLVDCSAEPSASAGYDGNARYVIDTNLVGTTNCLEAVRRCCADFIFVSTSRVYPVQALRDLPLIRSNTRFELPSDQHGQGWSSEGITTAFPLDGARTLYGATKLCSELIITEYAAMYGVRAIINRCGVLTGPWQMGKVDQGFVALWAARHFFGGRLSYLGFGGKGWQVRDVLHIADFYQLLECQIASFADHCGSIYNVGGGRKVSISLLELTELCMERVNRRLEVGSNTAIREGDIPYYVTDISEVEAATGWEPRRSVETILDDVFNWISAERARLESFFRN